MLLGAFGRKSSSEVPDTRNSAFGPETRVLQLFRAERTEMLQNTLKHRFGSNGGYWVRSGKKACRRFRTPETMHSALKHKFCNFFVQNVSKCSKTLPNIILGSNGGYWVRSGKKACRRFRTPETVHSALKH